jgi:GNAT superfamily N-acetyltransferase
MTSTIRRAKAEDLEGVSALFDLYRVFYKKDSDREAAKKFLLARIGQAESVVFIAEMENRMVGFTQLYPLYSSLGMKRSWLLNDLYVLEACRGKGISKQLLDAAKQLAIQTGAAGIMLETERTNIIGNKLYPSSGFIPYDKNNFYWWENG